MIINAKLHCNYDKTYRIWINDELINPNVFTLAFLKKQVLLKKILL